MALLGFTPALHSPRPRFPSVSRGILPPHDAHGATVVVMNDITPRVFVLGSLEDREARAPLEHGVLALLYTLPGASQVPCVRERLG